MVGVPPGTEVQVRLLEVTQETLPGDHRIWPSPVLEVEQPSFDEEDMPSVGRPKLRDVGIEEDPSIYGTNAFYPAAPARLAAQGSIRHQDVAQFEFYPVQANPVTGELLHTSRLLLEIEFDYLQGQSGPDSAGTIEESEAFERLLRHSLVNYEAARHYRSLGVASDSLQPASVATSPDPGYRVRVASTGIYTMSYEYLRDVGGVPVSTLDTLDPRTFQIFSHDPETGANEESAIYVHGETDGRFDPGPGGDYILFYGEAISGTYTKYVSENVYWLTYDPAGTTTGKRMATPSGGLNGQPVPTSFEETLHFETNAGYWSAMPGEDDHLSRWYWTTVPGGGERVRTATLTGVAAVSATANLRITIHGYGSAEHHIVVDVNTCLDVGEFSWLGQTTASVDIPVSQACLAEGVNNIRFRALAQDCRLDWFEITYQRLYQAGGEDILAYSTEAQTGGWEVWVDGFSSDDVRTFDVSDPLNVAWVTTPPLEPSATTTGYLLKFGDPVGGRRFWSQVAGSWPTPSGIELDTPSDLHSATNRADYVMITYADFAPALAPLVTYYTTEIAEPIEVMVVDVQDVYDEWSGGMLYPGAIRAFLAHAFTNWALAPGYVLLVGDGHYDYTYNASNTDLGQYVPPYMAFVDPWVGEQGTDNRYVSIVGDDAWPDMVIGRFPVNSLAETEAMVTKSVNYQKDPHSSDWYQGISFVADNPEGGDDFWYWADQIADNYVPETYTIDKVYYGSNTAEWGDYTTGSAVTGAVDAAFAEGRLFVYYNGHGAIPWWAEEQLFHKDDATALTNTDRWPIMLPMTCQEGQFTYRTSALPSLSEVLVRADVGGAVASWAPTGWGLSSDHDLLGKGFFQAVFADGVSRLGDATMAAKQYLWDASNCALVAAYPPHAACSLIETYVLLGDPYLQINIDAPTAVQLAAFRPELGPEGTVLLHWETASEIDTLGFNLYRAYSRDGSWSKLNAWLIPAEAGGSAAGASYRFEDVSAQAGVTYHYWLEVVGIHGAKELFGPLIVDLGPNSPGNLRIFLPLIAHTH
jgi:hypothetical protein